MSAAAQWNTVTARISVVEKENDSDTAVNGKLGIVDAFQWMGQRFF